MGIRVRVRLKVVAVHPFAGTLVVEIGSRHVTLSRGIVQRVMVRAALLVGGAMRWALIG